MKYESEVFVEVGRWENYDHLETSLSLDELLEIYEAVIDKRNTEARQQARMMGIDVKEPPPRKRGDETEDKQAWQEMQERIRAKYKEQAQTEEQDDTSVPGISYKQI